MVALSHEWRQIGDWPVVRDSTGRGIPAQTDRNSPSPPRAAISVSETDYDKLPHWEAHGRWCIRVVQRNAQHSPLPRRHAPEELLRMCNASAVRGTGDECMAAHCHNDNMIRSASTRLELFPPREWCKPRDPAGLCPLCVAAAQLFDPVYVRPPSIRQPFSDTTGRNRQRDY
ncbi:hypothetical protein LX36DRAFT_347065 [Colletotrichum falcatum]|nr:hypothetical protein LX36DRAFT_347065 [Colletotrichum falcatum]